MVQRTRLGDDGEIIMMMIIKRIFRAPIYGTRWEHRALYNNTDNRQTHTHTDAHARARTHARTHARARAHTHTHRRTRARTNGRMHARTHSCVERLEK